MQQYIVDGMTGEAALTVINMNCTELYSALVIPIKTSVSEAQTQAISANTFITQITLLPVGGTPIIDIGTTNGGGEILPNFKVSSFQPIVVQQYFAAAAILYFNLSGVGSVNVRIDYIPNYI